MSVQIANHRTINAILSRVLDNAELSGATAQDMANVLYQTNIDAYNSRYGESFNDEIQFVYEAYIDEPTFIGCVRYLNYQLCDDYDYETSKAYAILTKFLVEVASETWDSSRDYEERNHVETPWGLDD